MRRRLKIALTTVILPLIPVETDCFSVFAIGYTDTMLELDVPDTGSAVKTAIWLPVVLGIGLALVLTIRKKGII